MNQKDKIGIILIFIAIIYLAITSFIGLTTGGLWGDELFSYGMGKIPFSEFLNIGLNDVHPLLYYLILRFFLIIAMFFNITNLVAVSKFVSLIPIYLTLIIGCYYLKKHFNILTAGVFALCITSMPQLMIYSVEVRMYSWALFFLTASFLIIYDIVKSNSIKKWIILTILTICSCYTHYFSALTSGVLYLLFLLYIIRNNKNLLKSWFCSAIISAISFGLWIPILLKQANGVYNNFWIDPVSGKSIITYVYYILSPANQFAYSNIYINPTIMGTLMLILIISLFCYYFRSKNENNVKLSYYGLVTVLLVITIGICISFLTKPIMHPRYLIPLIGIFWISVSILISKTYKNKKIFSIIIMFLILVGCIGTHNFIHIEKTQEIDCNNLQDQFNIFDSKSIIIYDDS